MLLHVVKQEAGRMRVEPRELGLLVSLMYSIIMLRIVKQD